MKAEADMMSSSLIIESLFEYDYKSNKRSCQGKNRNNPEFPGKTAAPRSVGWQGAVGCGTMFPEKGERSMDSGKTGTLIAEARKAKGLTQRQLAETLHISDRTVSKWERGVSHS